MHKKFQINRPTKKQIRAAIESQAPDGWTLPEKPKRRRKIEDDGREIDLDEHGKS